MTVPGSILKVAGDEGNYRSLTSMRAYRKPSAYSANWDVYDTSNVPRANLPDS